MIGTLDKNKLEAARNFSAKNKSKDKKLNSCYRYSQRLLKR